MKLVIEKEEMERIYTFTSNLRNNTMNKIFNLIFGKSHHRLIELSTNDNEDTIIKISNKVSIPVLNTWVKHSYKLSTLCTGGYSLSLLIKWKMAMSALGEDILKAINEQKG